MGFVARDTGLDLGTSNTQVCVAGKGVVLSEPTIVIVDGANHRKVLAAGQDAGTMLDHTTEGIIAIRPMKEGVITDFTMMQVLIQYYVRGAIGKSYLVKPNLFLSYPCLISAIERRALGEAAKAAGARKVFMVKKPFLSALGTGLPVMEPVGCLIVDIGGGTTDIALVSLGDIVVDHSVRVGGMKMDEAIADYIKQKFSLLIGDRTAEEIKLDLGSALPLREERMARIRGRDLVTALPKIVEVSSAQIYEAIHEPAMAIVEAVKKVLERTPPELTADIKHNGIYLTGGGSLLYGMDALIATELGLPVLLCKDPMISAAQGLYELMTHKDSFMGQGTHSVITTF